MWEIIVRYKNGTWLHYKDLSLERAVEMSELFTAEYDPDISYTEFGPMAVI